MDKALRVAPFAANHILLTGATGYMGALIAASLLRDTAARITCLTRSVHDRKALLDPIIEEWEAQAHGCWSGAVENRIHQMQLPDDLADVADLAPQLEGVDEIIHCAGCLDYYDAAKLQAVNVGYTAHLLVLARRLSLKRFVYISTAYSSGYQPHPTAEGLLPEPPSDPTQYTRTKRKAERLVSAGGVPFVIIRPSILIGTSDTGRYSGKRYGLYQQWMGLERLACDRYHAAFHTVEVTRPQTIYYYPSFGDVPFKDIPTRQRAYLTFAQVNLEIASHRWQFETTWLDLLRDNGLSFFDATVDSVRVCQDRFVASSELIGRYLTRHAAELASHPRVVEVAPEQAADKREMASV